MNHRDFFALHGDYEIRLWTDADGLRSRITVEDLYRMFKERLDADFSAELAAAQQQLRTPRPQG